ncbi:MAG: hypothetical protein R3283_10745, partial [Balneolaceae bacterium]|nr:hypothetical protein [Balneolaceae bacterium]
MRISSMENKKKKEEEIIDEIRQLFDPDFNSPEPDEEMWQFLDERIEIEKGDASRSLKCYVEQYETLKQYGLEDKLMESLEFFIRFELEHSRDEFLKTEFYRKFKDHKIVADAK